VYRRGVALINKKNQKIEEIKRLQSKDFNKNCTYTPRINKTSIYMLAKNMYRVTSFNKINFSYDQTLDKRVNQSRYTNNRSRSQKHFLKKDNNSFLLSDASKKRIKGQDVKDNNDQQEEEDSVNNNILKT